jgi:hypothetical protein
VLPLSAPAPCYLPRWPLATHHGKPPTTAPQHTCAAQPVCHQAITCSGPAIGVATHPAMRPRGHQGPAHHTPTHTALLSGPEVCTTGGSVPPHAHWYVLMVVFACCTASGPQLGQYTARPLLHCRCTVTAAAYMHLHTAPPSTQPPGSVTRWCAGVTQVTHMYAWYPPPVGTICQLFPARRLPHSYGHDYTNTSTSPELAPGDATCCSSADRSA